MTHFHVTHYTLSSFQEYFCTTAGIFKSEDMKLQFTIPFVCSPT